MGGMDTSSIYIYIYTIYTPNLRSVIILSIMRKGVSRIALEREGINEAERVEYVKRGVGIWGSEIAPNLRS